ncbi:MAG TPA: NADH:flavin oxidoreductase [Planctomycetota bacterium]|nr:NADH:flavin oxidoreductase [Planctomycetota bacterium]HRR80806.1 NADH:flavin oxidoreductase [Planctomycetota bacterium]
MTTVFTPARLGALELPNRLVRSATGEKMCRSDGSAPPSVPQFYARLARGGVGLLITGHSFVRADGKASEGMMGVHSDKMLPGLKAVVEAVQGNGGKVVCQINHAGRQTRPELIGGKRPVAPSAVVEKTTGLRPRALDPEEIEPLLDSYVTAACRCREAGFDGVQLHCAHGYLMSSFLSPHTNRRTDAWGGSLEARARFPLEAVRRIRAALGREFPLLVKLNAEDFIEGGLTLAQSCRIAAWLEAEGVDGIEISAGMAETADQIVRKHIDAPEKEGYFIPFAREFRQHVRVPLICVGGFRSLSVMEAALESGAADFVSLCRPLIREPELPRKLREGTSTRATCISCNCCGPDPEGRLACTLDLQLAKAGAQA